jgi:hypothetical protein
VSCATANATEARGVRRDATSSVAMSRARRRGARSVRADARKPKQIGEPKGAPHRGTPGERPARRSSAPVTNRRFSRTLFFHSPTDASSGTEAFFRFRFAPRSRSPPRPDARNDASLSKP